jgi:L-amino acid N-acyltransferase YncA
VQITEAQGAHWPQIYPILASIVAEGRTYAYPQGMSSEQTRDLWMEPPPSRVVVAVDGDTVLGTAKMGPNRPGRGAHIATASFMVDPGVAGRGIGRALAEHMIGWARTEGYRGVQFNAVVETNHAAVHLWRTLGFEVVGTVPGAFRDAEHGHVGLHVMFLDLTGGQTDVVARRPRHT